MMYTDKTYNSKIYLIHAIVHGFLVLHLIFEIEQQQPQGSTYTNTRASFHFFTILFLDPHSEPLADYKLHCLRIETPAAGLGAHR